jgi:hypothetical protein
MELVTMRRGFTKHPPMPSSGANVFAKFASLIGFDASTLDVVFSRERVLAISLLPPFF